MVQKLQELGLARLAAAGQSFDPTRHEAVAVQTVSDPAQDGVVVAELRPGFALGERVLRAAQVRVGKLRQ
jgi:molecular chaperone GrpE